MELEEKEPRPLCRLCAGMKKGTHTMDNKSCLPGRREWYKTLSRSEQLSEIRTYEMLVGTMVDYVGRVSEDRNVDPWQIMEEEKLWIL